MNPSVIGYTVLSSSVLATLGIESAASYLVIGISLVTLAGGIAGAVYGTKRSTELRAVKGAAQAWREERDAEKAKADRLEVTLRAEEARRQTAEARSDLSRVEKSQQEGMEILRSVAKTLNQITTAVEFLSKQSFDSSLMLPDDERNV